MRGSSLRNQGGRKKSANPRDLQGRKHGGSGRGRSVKRKERIEKSGITISIFKGEARLKERVYTRAEELR